MHASKKFREGGGSRSIWQKKVLTMFFSHQLIYRGGSTVNFKENYTFPRFQRGSNIFQREVQLFPEGIYNCLFHIETHTTCGFRGGGVRPDPLARPSGSAHFNCITSGLKLPIKCLDMNMYS